MLHNNIKIQNKIIGINHPTFIIAEIGVNHNGDLELAKELIQKAKACGADSVKFQTFQAKRVVTQRSPKANYQLKTTDPNESQFNMLCKLELSKKEFKTIVQYCKENDIIFLSTPYDIEDVDLLEELEVPAYKIASGQAVEHYFLEYIANKEKPILLSTGMCTLADVDEALNIVLNAGNDQIVILQCTTNYPSALKDANLKAMQTMANTFDALVGYSDHTQSITSAIAAVALGACVIERHFTLDKTLPGPDHVSSSEPDEFAQLVKMIRETESCLGSPKKFPTSVEVENAKGMRRSIVAKHYIKAGEKFTHENLSLKRPFNGLSGKFFNKLIGKTASCDIKPDMVIDFEMIK